MEETSQENQKSEKKSTEKTIWQSLSHLTRSELVASIGSLISGVIAAVVILAMLTMFVKKPFEKPIVIPTLSTVEDRFTTHILTPDLRFALADMRFFAHKVLKLEEDINNIKNQLDELMKLDTTTDVGAQIALTRSDVANLNSRIQILEDGLLDNPEKALSIPLIRKDIQKIEESYNQSFVVMAKSIDRVYDQNKWFIGLMFTMAIGLITLAVSNFIQVRKKI